MSFKASSLTNYKELGYDSTSGNLTSISIYTTSSKTTQLFDKTLGYDSTSGLLVQSTTVRNLDSKTLTKNLSYDVDDKLFSIEAGITT